jgi:hypothetical protein
MEIAIVLSLLNVLTLWAGARLKARANRQRERSVKRP